MSTEPNTKPSCAWKKSGDEFMPSTYFRECGAAWTFTEDGPKENGMNFCFHCGAALTVEVAA